MRYVSHLGDVSTCRPLVSNENPSKSNCCGERNNPDLATSHTASAAPVLPLTTLVRFPRATRLFSSDAALAALALAFSAVADADKRRPAGRLDIEADAANSVGKA